MKIFISAVSDEFESYRERFAEALTTPQNLLSEQKGLSFQIEISGSPILTTLADCIATCDVVFHLLGDRTGNVQDDSLLREKVLRGLRSQERDV